MNAYLKSLYLQYLRNPATYVVLLFPIIMLIGLGKWLPAAWIVPSTITIAITMNILFFFGAAIYDLRKTSIIKPMSLTRLTKVSIFSATMLFAIMVSMVSWGLILLFGFIFTEVFPFLATDFTAFDPALTYLTAEIEWSTIDWWTMVYTAVISFILSFSLAFFVTTFTKSTTTYYVFCFGYVSSMIIIGGIVLPTFLAEGLGTNVATLAYFMPHYYVNNMMVSSFSTTGLTPAELNSLLAVILDIIGGIDQFTGDLYFAEDVVQLAYAISADAIVEGVGIDWSKVGNVFYDDPTYTYAFQSDMGKSFAVEIIADPSGTGTTQFIVQLLAGVYTGQLENIFLVMFDWFEVGTAWDMNNWKSILDVFIPIAGITLFASVGILNFKWSQR